MHSGGKRDGREQNLALAFNELADILVCDFTVEEYLKALTTHCMQVLDVDAAGVLLAVDSERLEVVCATTEAARLLEVLQVTTNQGPCVECARTGLPISASDLRCEERWDEFTSAVLKAGFAAAHAIPLKLRGQVIGTLNLFRRRAGSLSREDRTLSQALADAATAGLLSKRAIDNAETLSMQLKSALNTRVVIEQAKGILSARRKSTLDNAFEVMRAFARNDRRKLSEIARAVVDGSPAVAELNRSP
jgi:transcriptional regulator with GAF, ATPase, and Fis domain